MLFDLSDTALFGLLPNEWRPRSIGEEIHGEPLLDRTFGNVGTLGGSLLGGALVLKGGKMALGGLKGWMGKSSAASNAGRAWQNAQPGGLLNMPMGPRSSFITPSPPMRGETATMRRNRDILDRWGGRPQPQWQEIR